MKENTRQHTIDGLFVLLGFGVFAVCILLVLLAGAQGYRAQTERDERSWQMRTGLQYVAAKIRHGDELGAVSVSGSDGERWYDTLQLEETIAGEQYTTAIYCDDGVIRELFGFKDSPLEKENGEEIMQAESLRFRLGAEGLLEIEYTDVNGTVGTLMIYPRCGEVRAS